MRVSKMSNLAIQLCLYLEKNKIKNLESFCQDLKFSLHFAEQTARKLRVSGIIKSVRGPGGGYVLLKSKEEISLWDILKCVDSLSIKQPFVFNETQISDSVQRLLNRLSQNLKEEYSKINLSQIV